ncbi:MULTISPECIES: IDEAL domain-containing protein [Bacillus]|uniref:IDEAL domain-containing protein n=1 Tax=Bacillus TaxID=1386 RepID=UPI000BB75397|nr:MULTISPECIES: IDEAL domain-containing protein [Bacillus]
MKNEKSYTELMKLKKQQAKKSSPENYVMNVYVQMILDESLFLYRKNKLQSKIDSALDSNNRTLFLSLSKEYNHFLTQWSNN